MCNRSKTNENMPPGRIYVLVRSRLLTIIPAFITHQVDTARNKAKGHLQETKKQRIELNTRKAQFAWASATVSPEKFLEISKKIQIELT